MKKHIALLTLLIVVVAGCSSADKVEGASDKTASSTVEVDRANSARTIGNPGVEPASGAGGDSVGK